MSKNRKAEYSAYLQSEAWKSKRRIAIDRAGGRCQLCNADGCILEVHHRTYERFGNEDLGDLTVLCGDCHRAFHKRQKKVAKREKKQKKNRRHPSSREIQARFREEEAVRARKALVEETDIFRNITRGSWRDRLPDDQRNSH